MKETLIEWCDSTINGSSGCDGCELWNANKRTCYAGNLQETRLSKSLPDLYSADFSEVRMIPGRFQQAANWSDLRGMPRRDKPWLDDKPRHIFVGDMGDFLSKGVTDEFLKRELFGAIASKNGSRHVWLLLTKQVERLAKLSIRMGGLPDNVIAMTTVTNQRTGYVRGEWLNEVMCKTKGLSIEPLLGPLELYEVLKVCWNVPMEHGKQWYDFQPDQIKWNRQALVGVDWKPGVHWVIAGGESGKDARPSHPNWFRFLRDQCVAMGVPFFFKQWGDYAEFDSGPLYGTMHPDSAEAHAVLQRAVNPSYVDIKGKRYLTRQDLPEDAACRLIERRGKSAAGRLLDGRQWNEMPSVP